MSHLTLGQDGVAAVSKREWDVGVTKLTQALKQSRSPNWLIARSKAWIGKGDFNRALEDADHAVAVANERGRRGLMMEGQYRRAVAYFRLKQWANADACCTWAQALASTAASNADPIQDHGLVDKNGFYTTDLQRLKQLAATMTPKEENKTLWGQAQSFHQQCWGMLEKTPDTDESRKISAKMRPDAPSWPAEDAGSKEADDNGEESDKGLEESGSSIQAKKMPTPTESKGYENVRISYYQSGNKISVTVFVKGLAESDFWASLEADQVTIGSIKNATGKLGVISFTPFERIDPLLSQVKLSPIKIELSLHSLAAGVRWKSLRKGTSDTAASAVTIPIIQSPATVSPGKFFGSETAMKAAQASMRDHSEEGSGDTPPPAARTTAASPTTSKPSVTNSPAIETSGQPKSAVIPGHSSKEPTPSNATAGRSTGPPAYPTSSKGGPKNWDSLDEAEDEDESKKDVNHFFQMLYQNATPEQQRAMMKSFVESNGTSLSTDWEDVKNRTVDTVPPEGVEAKKWEK